jgi:hypothetical protein
VLKGIIMKLTKKELKNFIYEMINEESSILKYGKAAAKYLMYTPAGLFFSMLIGCDGKGGHDDLSERHFIWWSSGNNQFESTCAYDLYDLQMTGDSEINMFIAYWDSSIFQEFSANESIFKSNDLGSGIDWEYALDELELFESGESQMFSENDVLSQNNLDTLASKGALMLFGISGGKVIARHNELGRVGQGVNVGMDIEDVVSYLESIGYTDISYNESKGN